jgi:hypothetical protein
MSIDETPVTVALREDGQIVRMDTEGRWVKQLGLRASIKVKPNQVEKPIKFRSSNNGMYIWGFNLQGSNKKFHYVACIVSDGSMSGFDGVPIEDKLYPEGGKQWTDYWVDDDGNLCLFTRPRVKKGEIRRSSLIISPEFPFDVVPNRDVKIDFHNTISISDQEWVTSLHSNIQRSRCYTLKRSDDMPGIQPGGGKTQKLENVWDMRYLPWFPISGSE